MREWIIEPMSDRNAGIKKFVRLVDAINNHIGRVACLLILPMAGVVVCGIMIRKVSNVPNSWGFETAVYLCGAHYMFGMAATYLYDRHVRIDIIVLQLPRKAQIWLRLFTFWLIFVPFIGVFTYAAGVYAAHSWEIWEHGRGILRIPFYAYKTVLAITLFLLLLQGIANFFRDYYALRGEKI